MPVRKEDLRKVKLSQFEDGSGDHVTNGYFHEWADVPYFSESNGSFKIKKAIVESEDGKIRFIDAFRLKFVDRF